MLPALMVLQLPVTWHKFDKIDTEGGFEIIRISTNLPGIVVIFWHIYLTLYPLEKKIIHQIFLIPCQMRR